MNGIAMHMTSGLILWALVFEIHKDWKLGEGDDLLNLSRSQHLP